MDIVEENFYHKEFDDMMQAFELSMKEYHEKRRELEQEYSGILIAATLALVVLDAALAEPNLSPYKNMLYFIERERLAVFIETFSGGE